MERLRTLGNAVVPAQAESAFIELMSWHEARRHGGAARKAASRK
jgi:hypothetical protein